MTKSTPELKYKFPNFVIMKQRETWDKIYKSEVFYVSARKADE